MHWPSRLRGLEEMRNGQWSSRGTVLLLVKPKKEIKLAARNAVFRWTQAVMNVTFSVLSMYKILLLVHASTFAAKKRETY